MANERTCDHWTNRTGPARSANHGVFKAVFRPGSSAVVAATEQLRPMLSEADWVALLDEVRAEARTSIVDGAVQRPGCVWITRAAVPA